jgi:hypothetical protein
MSLIVFVGFKLLGKYLLRNFVRFEGLIVGSLSQIVASVSNSANDFILRNYDEPGTFGPPVHS